MIKINEIHLMLCQEKLDFTNACLKGFLNILYKILKMYGPWIDFEMSLVDLIYVIVL